MKLVFLHSPFPRCGKTTAADYLCKKYGFQRIAFADALRRIAKVLLMEVGYTHIQAEYYLNVGKSEELSYLEGITPRYLLQKLGTEFGRNLIDDAIWLKAFDNNCIQIAEQGSERKEGIRLVCDDMRFPNEFEYAEAVGGTTVWINRKAAVPPKPPAPAILDALAHKVPILRPLVRRFFSYYHASNNALKGREREFDFVVHNDAEVSDLFFCLDYIMEEVLR